MLVALAPVQVIMPSCAKICIAAHKFSTLIACSHIHVYGHRAISDVNRPSGRSQQRHIGHSIKLFVKCKRLANSRPITITINLSSYLFNPHYCAWEKKPPAQFLTQ